LGSRKVLDANDVGVPSKQDVAEEAYKNTNEAWDRELTKTAVINERRHRVNKKLRDPRIVSALLSSFGQTKFIAAFVYYLLAALLNFVPVFILNDLVTFLESGVDWEEWGGIIPPWAEVVGLAIIPWISSTLETRHQTIMAHSRVFLRSALSSMVYQKSLRVSPMGRAATSTGQVVNMMSNDINQMQKFLEVAGLTAVAPIQVAIAIVLIYQQVRSPCFCEKGPPKEQSLKIISLPR
jgi:ABC-type multidrug transport system fused ATPase/permease subunit